MDTQMSLLDAEDAEPTPEQQALADALERQGYDDWYSALLHAAIQETADVDQAIATADKLFAEHPADQSTPQDDDADVLFSAPDDGDDAASPADPGDAAEKAVLLELLKGIEVLKIGLFDEESHPRGQPDNPGQFASKPTSEMPPPPDEGEAGGEQAPQAKPAGGKPSEKPGGKPAQGQKGVYAPDPTERNAETGLVDKARVGVPAMSVPPPPAEIGRLPNLGKKARKVEARFAEAYLADPDGMAKKYLKALRKGKVGVAPNVFATDDVKMLNPDWNPAGAGKLGEKLPRDVKKAMAKYNAAVHQTANAIAKRAFVAYLDDVVKKLPPERRSVLVTNGGCAAGKGSSLARSTDPDDPHYGMLPAMEQVGAIWDAAGEQNATENEWILEECKKRGIKPTFAYVWAEPKDTWDGEDRGVIRRALRKGRMVDARLFADSYAHGAKNMKDFVDKHQGEKGMDFIFLDNRKKSAPKLLDAFPEETLQWDADQIYRDALAGLESRASELDETLIKGGTNGTTIWGKPEAAGREAVRQAG